MPQNISSNRVRVTVGGQVFEIPAVKLSELQSLLAQWQSIAVTENSPQKSNNWAGKTLLNG